MVVSASRVIRVANSSKLAYLLLLVLLLVIIRRRGGDGDGLQRVDGLDHSGIEAAAAAAAFAAGAQGDPKDREMAGKWFKGLKKSVECPDYVEYSQFRHGPLSEGPLRLPYMRPSEGCRTFRSEAVEKVISDMRERIQDPDLFRIFENAFPNTLDTTILWHTASDKETGTPRTFISTGDIHAEWLRDSARQLSVYQPLCKHDDELRLMIKGAIIQQAMYISKAPYCNAYQPPAGSGVDKKPSSIDDVIPRPPWKHVFECKWELDSLASFLTLTNEYYEHSGDASVFKDPRWLNALELVLVVLRRESSPTFDESGNLLPFYYTFQRETRIGTETLPLAGTGNPVRGETGLIRSAFRPSDDACIYQLFIPANAQMQVELVKLAPALVATGHKDLAQTAKDFAAKIRQGIEKYGVVDHTDFGRVLAYEVDGFGGTNMMDDANIPSLLALPDMGYLDVSDPIYQNTRKMILSKQGNPYYLSGKYFKGIGGPHIGLGNAWPMSLLLQIRTTDDDDEITELLQLLKTTTAGLGLMHESINVNSPINHYTRPWFSWCNSEFGKTILDLAERKPYLIFREEYKQEGYIVRG